MDVTKLNVIIPAAGAATRLQPLSNHTSKIMVRVNGKPCFDYIWESINKSLSTSQELGEVIVVTGKFEDTQDYINKNKNRFYNVKCVKQEAMIGPRDAISTGMQALEQPNNPVVIWLGDTIIRDTLPLGTDFLATMPVKDHSSWCMWDGADYFNKPSYKVPDAKALVGVYSFEDGSVAKDAFVNIDGYEISDSLDTSGVEFDDVIVSKWYDIGDLPNYYKTCGALLTTKARAFNNLEFDSSLSTVRKTPNYHDKASIETLRNEKAWYDELTPEQSMLTPRILPHATDLIMSYESGTLLSDLMLYDNLNTSTWEYIIDKVFKIKLGYFNSRINENWMVNEFSDLSHAMWVDKTNDRLNDLEDSDICEKIGQYSIDVWKQTTPVGCHHGDLHFGNILYNQATDQLKLIDPRGNYGSHTGALGDNLYDWCKLGHDLIYGYSSLVANVEQNESVKDIFLDKLDEYDLPKDIIKKGSLVLLATCIPLHYDDTKRQQRMINRVKENIK